MKPALTIQQVAEIFSVNERTVYRMVSRGDLPGFRVAGSWRILAEDLEAWIDQQKATAKCGSTEDCDREEEA